MSPRAINIARAEDVLGKPKAASKPELPIFKPSSDGGMNKTEARFKREVVDKMPGVFCCVYESVKFRLADRTWYTPDFVVFLDDGNDQVYEVKGSWKAPHQEDSRVKLKVAAELYPQFTFFAAVPNKETGGWDIEEIPCRARS